LYRSKLYPIKKIPETSNAPIQDFLKCPRYENKLPGKLISESGEGTYFSWFTLNMKKLLFNPKKLNKKLTLKFKMKVQL
jgi:hypothetical protein